MFCAWLMCEEDKESFKKPNNLGIVLFSKFNIYEKIDLSLMSM